MNFAEEKLGIKVHSSIVFHNMFYCMLLFTFFFHTQVIDWILWGIKSIKEVNVKNEDKTITKDLGKKVLFKDVIGIDEFKDELMEIVDYLKNPEKYEEMGAYVPKGILLSGRPGTGKTMLAQALANEADCTFLYKSGAEFDHVFVGSGARNVRELFKKARKKAPAIIFIDEIDSIGGERMTGRNNTLN